MNKDIISQIIGWLLISGTIISYIPQYYRIYRYKSSKGISEWMLIYGGLSCMYNVFGTFESERDKLNNCNYCYKVLLPLVQLTIPWICGLIFYATFIIFYRGDDEISNIRRRLIIFILVNIISVILVVLWNLMSNNNVIADVLSIISSVFSIIMWMPQIRTTHKTGEQGSLSVISLLVHAVGCLITVIYQCYFNNVSILVIASYIISFLLEMYIVVICIYFNRKTRKFQELKDLILEK